MEWAFSMGVVRAHVILPEKMAEEIDKVAGPRGRSAFLVESAEKEIRRIKLQAFLDNATPAWKQESHSDIETAGSAAWVHNQRQKASMRQLLIEAWAEENNS
jgi:hypothetical protein